MEGQQFHLKESYQGLNKKGNQRVGQIISRGEA